MSKLLFSYNESEWGPAESCGHYSLSFEEEKQGYFAR